MRPAQASVSHAAELPDAAVAERTPPRPAEPAGAGATELTSADATARDALRSACTHQQHNKQANVSHSPGTGASITQ